MLTFACIFTMPFAAIATAAPAGDGLGRARFSWEAVPDPIVSGYKVYWGTASGVYTHTEDAGNATELIVTGFSEGGAYFAAVTAYSDTGEESDYSTEISFIYDTSSMVITLTSQPQAQVVTVGQATTFSVTATGSGTLTYQWKKGGATIEGAMDSTYTIGSPVVTDAGNYNVVVANADGNTTSDAATLTVNPATPVITETPAAAASRYELEMAFSRGLHPGWLHGVNHQELVHARFGKKRGVWLGEVSRVESEQVALRLLAPLKPGDGVVFDAGRPDEDEEGGRVYQVEARGAETWLRFGQGDVDFHRIHPGHKVWKTSDPALERRLRQSFAGPQPRFLRPVSAEVHGSVGQPLTLLLRDELGHLVCLNSTLPLAQAQTQPLTPERLREQLGRLGGTPFQLRLLTSHLADNVMLPVSELNRLRREAVAELTAQRAQPPRWTLNGNLSRDDSVRTAPILGRSSPGPAEGSGPIPRRWQEDVAAAGTARTPAAPVAPHLIVLVRSLPQLEAALRGGVRTIYTEFEDPKKYREAVRLVREAAPCADADPQRASGSGPLEIWVAPPRIFKPGEEWILKQVRACDADGYLVRNHEQLSFFAGERRLGDYSLNVANHLAAEYFLQRFGLERVTVSYDLNFQQLAALLLAGGADRLEVTLQQHMPMFHMEHCVFCAFLSTGTDYTNCGRPCDRHDVRLRDRVGALHPLRADAGCRNTVFNSQAQTGAEYVERMIALGLRHFRLEFLDETPEQVALTIARYRQLLRGEVSGAQLWKQLRLQNQLGVTRGQMAQEDRRAAAAAQQLARQW